LGACADISLIPSVDMGLVLISTKIVRWKSGAAGTLISRAGWDTLIKYATIEFSYIWSSPALLGCRRSCFSEKTVCQPL